MAVIVSKQLKTPYLGRLPFGYIELAYLQSSGTQYIDTGYKPNQNTRIVMDSQLNSTPNGNVFLFGARGNGAVQMFELVYIASTGFRADYGSSIASFGSSVGATELLHLDFNKNSATLNDKVTKTLTSSTFNSPVNLVLFCVNSNGSKSSYASMKLYSFQIYDNGTIVRDYIPCIDPNGSVGLYDLVNEKFYTNAGTGVFTGSVVV